MNQNVSSRGLLSSAPKQAPAARPQPRKTRTVLALFTLDRQLSAEDVPGETEDSPAGQDCRCSRESASRKLRSVFTHRSPARSSILAVKKLVNTCRESPANSNGVVSVVILPLAEVRPRIFFDKANQNS